MNKHLKRILIIVLVLALVGGGTYGGLTIAKNLNKKPVNVFDIANFSTSDMYIGGNSSYGMVRMDNMQKIFLSSTQSVTEVYVTEGQSVKAGDPLMSFDTTLSKLDVEKSEIALEKEKMELENQKKVLEKLKTARITEDIEAMLKSLQAQLDAVYGNMPEPEYPELPMGSWTEEDPYYMEYEEDLSVEDLFTESGLDDIWLVLANGADGQYSDYFGVHLTKGSQNTEDPEAEMEEETTAEPETESTEESTHISFFIPMPIEPEYPEEPAEIASLQAQIDQVSKLYENAYSREELAQLKESTAKAISDLELNIKIAEVELEKSKAEVSDGVIKATIDGIVKSVVPLEEMGVTPDAVLTVSGGGGYYITCSIGEFDKDNYKIGDSVTVNDWMSESTITGEIVEIGDRPTDEYNWSNGNNNISWYPLTVFVNEDANLQENAWVDIMFDDTASDPEGASEKFYIEKCFVRSEGTKYYAYVRGADDLLEKRYLRTGQELWGSYIEIKEGVALGDYLAFPYGRDVIEGAETVVAEPDVLWNAY